MAEQTSPKLSTSAELLSALGNAPRDKQSPELRTLLFSLDRYHNARQDPSNSRSLPRSFSRVRNDFDAWAGSIAPAQRVGADRHTPLRGFARALRRLFGSNNKEMNAVMERLGAELAHEQRMLFPGTTHEPEQPLRKYIDPAILRSEVKRYRDRVMQDSQGRERTRPQVSGPGASRTGLRQTPQRNRPLPPIPKQAGTDPHPATQGPSMSQSKAAKRTKRPLPTIPRRPLPLIPGQTVTPTHADIHNQFAPLDAADEELGQVVTATKKRLINGDDTAGIANAGLLSLPASRRRNQPLTPTAPKPTVATVKKASSQSRSLTPK